MTDSTQAAPATPGAPEKPASFWEDFIDIFFEPVAVFRRRENANPWGPFLVVGIVIAAIGFFTVNSLMPIIDAEMSRGMAEQMRKNPQFTQAMADKARTMGEAFARFGGIFVFVAMFVLGVVTWLVGKLFGSQQKFGTAVTVVAYSYTPRIIGGVVLAVQGLLMDTTKLTSQAQISISPARFLDPATANPLLLAFLTRLDLFTLWVTVLLAIGMYVTGKISKEKAVAYGALIWLVGGLAAFRAAYMQM